MEITSFSSTSVFDSFSSTSVFDIGTYPTVALHTDRSYHCINSSSPPPYFPPPPKPLVISTPSQPGNFPVILFLHGYLLFNYFYCQLIQQISSHGFIVVAPQLYSFEGSSATGEIIAAANITNWLPDGLHHVLPSQVEPNLEKLALAGHSRGGKDAFALTLGKVPNVSTKLKFSALIGIDPVDGTGKGHQTPPPVLTYKSQSFNLDMPVMVIGSGLGEDYKFVWVPPMFLPPCAPKGVNHCEFYNECRQPAFHFVAKHYGHLDVLDDKTEGIRGFLCHWLCKNGKSREPMRKFVGGVVVAFLEAYLKGDSTDLMAIKDGHVTLPVELQDVDCPL